MSVGPVGVAGRYALLYTSINDIDIEVLLKKVNLFDRLYHCLNSYIPIRYLVKCITNFF